MRESNLELFHHLYKIWFNNIVILFISNSNVTFPLDLTDPNADPTKQFANGALPYAFVTHGFTDSYPGDIKIGSTRK